MSGVWREPAEESSDLYPGLVVHDDRHSGSITLGATRLPASAVVGEAIRSGWESVRRGYAPVEFTEEQFIEFLYLLLEPRGEFARLILTLADVERDDYERGERHDDDVPWWKHPPSRDRVLAQLRCCVAVLEAQP